MAVTRYTTYQTLKGADFSADSSKVDRTRSPDILNMISDEGGNPIKRKGWEKITTARVNENGQTYYGTFEGIYNIGAELPICEVTANGATEFGYSDNDYSSIIRLGYSHTPGRARCVYNDSLITIDSGYRQYYMNGNALDTDNDTEVPITLFAIDPDTGAGSSLNGANLLNSTRKYRYIWGGSYGARWKGTKAAGSLPSTYTEGDAYRMTSAGTDSGITWEVGDIAVATMSKSSGSGNYWAKLSPEIKIIVPNGSTLDTANCKVRTLLNGGTFYEYSGTNWSAKTEDGGLTYYTFTLDTASGFGASDSYPCVTGTDNIEIELVFSTESTAYSDAVSRLRSCTASCIYQNRIFYGGCTVKGYENYIWYSEAGNPSYIPDLNYIVTSGVVAGFLNIGNSLAVIKKGQHTTIDFISSVTLTDTTASVSGTSTTTEREAYRIVSGTAGVGAISGDTFADLLGEPLFLSKEGIMGLTSTSTTDEKIVRNRSGFVDRKLLSEPNLENAVACVYKNYYILAVNGHAYILDARQKASDVKGNTSYLYEAYYWDNIPAEHFARSGEHLYFTMTDGKSWLCRFKNKGTASDYSDNTLHGYRPFGINANMLSPEGLFDMFTVADENDEIVRPLLAQDGGTDAQPINAYFVSVPDDDGTMAYYKTVQKKGTGCSVVPYDKTSVTAYFIPDDKEERLIGTRKIDGNGDNLEFSTFTSKDYYFRKKQKKYKRLQIKLANNAVNEPFGVLEIYKAYEIGNFAKR